MINEFWGKALPESGNETAVHPLVAHSLDVAAVAVLLPRNPEFSIDARMTGFLVSLHDIGKFSRPFQAKSPVHWPTYTLGVYPEERPVDLSHDAVGLYFLSDLLSDNLNIHLPPHPHTRPGWRHENRHHLWRALTGHHGRPPAQIDRLSSKVACAACREAATQFIDVMQSVFQPAPWKRPNDETDVVRFSWHLAGLTTLADWIGSRQAWFPYMPATAVQDPAAYFWNYALPRAAAALAAAGLAPSRPAPFTGLRRLFPAIEKPTPVQQWAERVPLPDGPILAVIEDLTGSGKTEAALTLAHRLMASGRASGVYLALPTMATANAMFGRLSDCYRALFATDTRPSLALAHGRADLDPRFAASIEGDAPSTPRGADPADEPAESHCSSWLAMDRRRALLAQVGVGTLDQALLAVLPVRHAPLRLQGLSRKVLIVDEVHAFDPYMREELATLLQFHAALGGSTVLLSATLPHKSRQKLLRAFRTGLGAADDKLTETSYPLATIAGSDAMMEAPCLPREGLPRRVMITRVPDPAAAVERIAAAAALGAAVVWVRNTVDDAIAAVQALWARGLEPLLFHARFAMSDRLAIEQSVLARFGRDSAGGARRGVLVATQVVEQSLDIDFDLMVTDLAPADLLIQRAGRLWRHSRDGRCLSRPELLIISPEPVDAPAANWIMSTLPGTGSVYRDHALLWRSARAVFSRGAITTPDDMRPIIESVYDADAEGAVPPALTRSADEAYSKERSHIGIAAQNVLNLRKGYAKDAGSWDPDTDTPTRLEDRPHVTLRLALLRDGAIMPYASDPEPASPDSLVIRRAWALSEVLVPQYRIAACPLRGSLQKASDTAKAQWGRWERDSPFVLLALLVPDGDGYRLDARTESGSEVVARYDTRTGLSWMAAEPADAG